MKVSNLDDALLDYWTARAEGVPADELHIRLQVPENVHVCFRGNAAPFGVIRRVEYSTSWAMGGPLLDSHHMWISDDGEGVCYASKVPHVNEAMQEGPTVLIAICRAVVRATFGEEVPELEPA